MQNLFIWFLTISLLTNCTDKKEGKDKAVIDSGLISTTKNENKGIDEILEFYGGQCKYAVGTSASTDKGVIKYFELEVSQSEVIEKYANIAQMPASNVAYLFFDNLQADNNGYDEIHTVLVFNDGEKMKFTFPTNELQTVKERIESIEKIVEHIKTGNFEAIKPMLNPNSILKYDKDELITNMAKVDSGFGEVKEFLPYGYRINNTQTGKDILHISGVLVREIQSHEFSADIDLNAPKNEVLRIQYKL